MVTRCQDGDGPLRAPKTLFRNLQMTSRTLLPCFYTIYGPSYEIYDHVDFNRTDSMSPAKICRIWINVTASSKIPLVRRDEPKTSQIKLALP